MSNKKVQFMMDSHYNDKPISTEELRKLVEKEEPRLKGIFRERGFISSKEYAFITIANFYDEKNCGLDENVFTNVLKTDEEKKLANENLDFMKNHLQQRIPTQNIEVSFAHRNSSECVLININKFSYCDIQRVLNDYFD